VSVSPERSRGEGPSRLDLDPGLERGGMNLAGVLPADRYDVLVPRAWHIREILPRARSVVVLGSAGPAFYRAAMRWQEEPGRASSHPLDEFCESLLREAVARLGREGFGATFFCYWESRGVGGERPVFADFVALGRACGLGAPSRLGQLLHPRHGPWFAIRSLLFTEKQLPDCPELPRAFDPCSQCPAPCIEACHGHAIDPDRSGFGLDACARARQEDPRCASRCDARLACPLGVDSVYDSLELAHHMRAPFRGKIGG
jgi:epoxyqueuosine reductase